MFASLLESKMSSFDTSLYDYDCGYFEYMPNFWLPGKLIPGSTFGCVSRRAVETAITAELKDTDILVGTYMKTGMCIGMARGGRCLFGLFLFCNIRRNVGLKPFPQIRLETAAAFEIHAEHTRNKCLVIQKENAKRNMTFCA